MTRPKWDKPTIIDLLWAAAVLLVVAVVWIGVEV